MKNPKTIHFTLLLVAALGGSGCLDLTPRVVPVDAGVDAVRVESDAEADAGPSACWSCLISPNTPGPGCAAEWASCMEFPRCTTIIECMEEIGCLKLADRGDLIACISLCAPRIGGVKATDPVIGQLTPVTMCTRLGPCAPACTGSEPPPTIQFSGESRR